MMEAVLKAVCNVTGVDRYDIMQNGRGARKGNIPLARQLCQTLSVKMKLGTVQEVASFFRRDRTTVIYSVKTIKGYFQYDKSFRKLYWKIRREYVKEYELSDCNFEYQYIR